MFATTAEAAEIAMLAKNKSFFNIVPRGLVPHMHHQYTIYNANKHLHSPPLILKQWNAWASGKQDS